jgi:ribosomal-protein-alanine N-acetyltransferase
MIAMTRVRDERALSVRAMLPADLDHVMEIERDIYPFPWSSGNFADSLRAAYDGWMFALDARVAGYAVLMWMPDEVHLLNISVARALQGRGVGRRMLAWICADVRRRGARAMLLEVRPSNTVGRALYESCGFVQIGVRKGYYPDTGGRREDALVLLLRFDQVGNAS